jgi:hypothetical protein
MNWQKWLIRGLVVSLVAVLAAGGILYSLWTSPQAIRQLVQEKLGVRFLSVSVEVGSARLRLLGGILVRELRLARSDALDRAGFLYVPSAVIHHDKEQMLDGKVAIRRVELTRPHLRLIRERDGRFNLTGILGPVELHERMPTLVIRQGTIVFEDRSKSESTILEIRDVHLTMINDPLPTLQIEGTGQVDLLGPVRFRASIHRATFAASMDLDLSAITLNADLAQRISGYRPELASHLSGLSATGQVRAKLQIPADPSKPVAHDVTVNLRDGRWSHPRLPRPLEAISFSTRLVDGVLPEAKLTATCAGAKLDARAVDVKIPTSRPDIAAIDHLLRELDLNVDHLMVDDEVLARLPADLQFIKEDFSPAGPVSIRYRYRQATRGAPVKEWTFLPEGMTGSFIDFPYPVANARGTIWLDTSRLPYRNLRLNLTGQGGGQPLSLRGTIKGEKKTSEVILDITGKSILLDHRLMKAMPLRVQKVANQFLPAQSRKYGLAAFPMGKGDFDVAIRRLRGETRINKRFTIAFHGCSVQYDQFPYPLENVSGVLEVHPDHWVAKDFYGNHLGGEMFVSGRSMRLPGRYILLSSGSGDPTPPERVHIQIRAKDILLNSEFENALVPASGQERRELQSAWKRLRLTGRLSFSAEVIDDPGQPHNIDVSANIQGCAMKPAFFDYALEQLSGSVRYVRGRLQLRDMTAMHGKSALALKSGLIELGNEGGFTAWLEGLTGQHVHADADLLHALPESLRRILEAVRLRTPVDLATKLTLLAPGGSRPMEVWWEGAVGLHQASLRTGVEVTDANGKLFCKGYHDGRRLRGATGTLRLDSATILGQPLTNLGARLEMEPTSPDSLRVRDFKADLFGGALAGEARVETTPVLRYDVLLEALGVQLELLGRHNLGESSHKAQLQGPARAALHLTGEGSDLLNLKGNGRIDVPQGKMGQLPILLDLVKAVGLRMPDRTAFEQAHMVFTIEGPQIHVQQLDLYGNAVSLRGHGAVDLDGSNINLDFSATPGRMTQMLPAGIDVIPQAISGHLLKIKMRGKFGKGAASTIKFDKELIPGVVEPLRRVMGGS